MGSPSRNVQYHPPRLSEDRLNLPQPHSPSLPTHCSGKSGMRPVDVPREKNRCPVLPRQPHRVILVPALATEVHGVEALVRMARQKLLTIDGHLASAGRLDRRVSVPGARDELVELEREEAPLAPARVRGPGTLRDARHKEKVPQRLAAGVGRPAGFLRELGLRLDHRHGLRPDPALVDLGERDTETRLHPNRERVFPERCVGNVRRYAGIDDLAEMRPYRIRGGCRIGDSLERLDDDVTLGDLVTEQLRSHACHHAVPVADGSLAHHRGRRADAEEILGFEALADTADEQRHVRALATAVCVEFVENEEPKALAVADDTSVDVFLPRHEQLEHHEVGEEDVRGLVCNPAPLVSVFLSRVAGERAPPVSRHLVDELVELLHLGVRERVHRVDHDGVRTRFRAPPPCGQHVADDGNEEAK